MTRRKTPPGLGPSGTQLWRETTRNYTLRADELRILEAAAAELDLIETLREEMVGAPLTVRGSLGQPVINPLIPELRQHRATFASLVKQLALPDIAEAEPGTTSGSGDRWSTRTTKARHAANVRWTKGEY